MTPPEVIQLRSTDSVDPFKAIHTRLDRHEVALAELKASVGATPKILAAIVAVVGALAPYLPEVPRAVIHAFSAVFGG